MGLLESITGAQGPLTKDAQGNMVDATGRIVQTAANIADSAAVNQQTETNFQANHTSIALPDGTQAAGDLKQNPDGTFTMLDGPYAGLKLNAQQQPDPGSLQLVKSVQKGQSQPGGLPPGSYSVNPDGTLTIIDGRFGTPGTTVAKNGQYLNPDGTPYLAVPGDPKSGRWTVRQPDGAPATQNPNYKGEGVFYNKDGTGLIQQIPGEKTVEDIGSKVEDAGQKLIDGLKGLAAPGAPIDTSSADSETARANALADALGGQAGSAGAQADADRTLGGQTRAQQQDSITGLTAAANGTAPSAAELQLKQQAGIDASRQYGLAAALQGNNPGAALRQASLGAAQIAGTTNENAAINRANEQATARGQLASTLANVRAGDQGAVNTDVGQQNNLTGAQVSSQGQGVTSTGQKLTAETEKEKADAARAGALIGAGGTAASVLLSDKRAKKNIVKSDLADALARSVHGVEFTYRPEVEEDAEPHFGILADALEKAIPGVVHKGPSGFKEVHTGHLTLANTGMLSELARRLQDLEKGKGARR